MAFKKEFICGCDVPNCNAEICIYAVSELNALKILKSEGWNITNSRRFPNENIMYCPDHFNTKPS